MALKKFTPRERREEVEGVEVGSEVVPNSLLDALPGAP